MAVCSCTHANYHVLYLLSILKAAFAIVCCNVFQFEIDIFSEFLLNIRCKYISFEIGTMCITIDILKHLSNISGITLFLSHINLLLRDFISLYATLQGNNGTSNSTKTVKAFRSQRLFQQLQTWHLG